jgi:hypothetical protein
LLLPFYVWYDAAGVLKRQIKNQDKEEKDV